MAERATADVGTVVAEEHGSDFDALFERAARCQRELDFPRAELLYRLLLSRQPGNCEVYEHLGLLHLRKEELKKAQSAFQSAYRLNSPRKSLLENAIVALQIAVKHSPGESGYLHSLGQAWRGLGYPDKALEFFSRAVEVDPSNSAAHNHIGVVLYNHDQISKSLSSFVSAARAKSGSRAVLDNMGNSIFLILRHRYGRNLLPAGGEQYVGVDINEPFASSVGSSLIYSPGLKVVYAPVYGALDDGVNTAIYEAERSIVHELPARDGFLNEADLRWLVASALSLRRFRVGEAHGILSSKEILKFTIVMNPFDRLANEYLRTFVTGRDVSENKAKTAPVLNFAITEDVHASEEFVTFREFIEFLVERRGVDVHHEWWPMSRTVHPGYLDFVVRGESVEDDLAALNELTGLSLEVELGKRVAVEGRGVCADSSPAELLSRPHLPNAAELFDEELEKAVRKLYSSDFKLFGYENWSMEKCASLPLSVSRRIIAK